MKSLMSRSVVDTQLEPAEIKQLLAKGEIERDRLDVERVEGLGAAPVKIHEHLGRKSLVERELDRMKQAMATGEAFHYMDKPLEDVPEHDEHEGGPSSPSRREAKRKRDDSEEDKKRKKREKKKLKKKEKKKKKHARQRSSSIDDRPLESRKSRSRSLQNHR